MPSFNRVIVAGNLTRDPELRYTPQGTAVADVGLAINEKRKKGEDYIDETVFIDVTFWDRTAEVVCEYLKKGSAVLVDGKLKFDQWEKDGQRRSKISLTGLGMQMLGGRDEKTDRNEQAKRQDPRYSPPSTRDEDVPF